MTDAGLTDAGLTGAGPTDAGLTVTATGPLALLQDLGRPGQAHLGVSPSGAADRGALRLANRLVGNDEGAAAVECTLGGLAVTAHRLLWVAVTGAPTELGVNGTATSSHSTIALRPGDRLTVGAPPTGLRSYLAVRGGLVATPTLGSVARDVLSGLGPDPLREGDELHVGRSYGELPSTDCAPVRPLSRSLAVTPGPRRDWFADSAWRTLLAEPYTVGSDCDRVAVRLTGVTLDRARDDELPSEGLVRGSVQVPASGQPLVFLADHPVTGGYPVIAVLTEQSGDDAAQLRPGDAVRFVHRPGPAAWGHR